ncbi:hypothetical protein KY308_03295 [Candidatus Woesearchaeota archaeon]|nr:hypothetical protein [Candidatus Woesearchaeota archaeon]
MGILQDVILRLDQLGVTDVLLPFLLFFTVIFAILEKIKILGDKSRRFNVIVALVMALAVVIPHVAGMYPAGGDIVDIVNRAIPNVAVFVIAILMLFVLIGLWGAKPTWAGKATGWVAVLAAIVVLFIFAYAAGWTWGNLPDWLSWLDDPTTIGLIIVILVFVIVVAYITAEPKEEGKEGSIGKIGEEIGKLFGKEK